MRERLRELAERETEVGPGVLQEHPRRRAVRVARPGLARRAAAGLPRRAPARRGRQGRGHHRVPRLRALHDLRPRPAARAALAARVPQPGLAGNDALLKELLDAARRARPAARLRRLAVVRRRGEDDRQGRGDPGVHRPDHRDGRRGPAAATSSVLLDRAPAGPPGARQPSTPPTRRSTPRSCAASTSTSTPSRCAPTSTSRRSAAGPARRHRPAVRHRVRRGAGRRVVARGRRGLRRGRATASGSAGSTSTCTRAPGSTTTPRSSTWCPASRGEQLAEGVLVCNFSRNLMEHDHVVTLFHEFGHLVHHVLAGRHPWARFSGVATEWDFVEAPSQMLEEWAWDADVLQSFATDADGEPDPGRAGREDARGRRLRQGPLRPHPDVLRGAVATTCTRACRTTSPPRCSELQARYDVFSYVPDTHFHASFGHLEGYGSGYYTYMWSLVIAKDMFSAFDRDDMFDTSVSHRYRDRVLAAGGSKDAADLVADFLGRPYDFAPSRPGSTSSRSAQPRFVCDLWGDPRGRSRRRIGGKRRDTDVAEVVDDRCRLQPQLDARAAQDRPAGEDHAALATHVPPPVLGLQVEGPVDLQDHDAPVRQVPLAVEVAAAPVAVAATRCRSGATSPASRQSARRRSRRTTVRRRRCHRERAGTGPVAQLADVDGGALQGLGRREPLLNRRPPADRSPAGGGGRARR